MKKEEVTELEHPYFDIQVQMGVTKHMGGWKATQELAEMCHIEENKYVLIVGCGNGISACKLAKTYGCRIVGIDISEGMVELSRNWAQKESLTEIVGFRVADAQELPFEDDVFDAVISESVTSFPEDKVKAISEYVRVVKSGGFIGLNEVTWMQEPSPEMEEYVIRAIGGCKPETAQGWEKLLENSGLQDIIVRPYRMKKLEQAIGEIKMSGLVPPLKGFYKLTLSYLTKPAYRKAVNDMVRDATAIPRHFMKYYGYGIYAGRKSL